VNAAHECVRHLVVGVIVAYALLRNVT
jgi:hypothetical protein